MKAQSTEPTPEPTSRFLMGIAPDHCLSHGEDAEFVLTSDEIRAIDNSVLRRLAAECDHPEIKGRGVPDMALREYFRGQTTFSDFTE